MKLEAKDCGDGEFSERNAPTKPMIPKVRLIFLLDLTSMNHDCSRALVTLHVWRKIGVSRIGSNVLLTRLSV